MFIRMIAPAGTARSFAEHGTSAMAWGAPGTGTAGAAPCAAPAEAAAGAGRDGNAADEGGVQQDSTLMAMKTITSEGGAAPMARNELRPIVKLRSTAGTGYTYVTRKNRRNTPDRLTLRKYDPRARMRVLFREER
jgi:large subunit ribosomal protein L33